MMIGAVAPRILSVLLFLLSWEGAARIAASRLFPGPAAVLAVLVEESLRGPLLFHLAVTLGRVAAAFAVAMVIGTAIGIGMGRSPRLNAVFDSWLILLLNLPALVIIVLAYVWFGQTELAAIGAVAVNKIPTVAVTLREGTRGLDPDYAEMAESFRFGRWKMLRHVILPQLYPFLLAASRAGLALVWKIVLVAELLGRSDGVGFEIEIAFQRFDVTRILAYSLAFAIVIQGAEWGVLQPLENRMMRWRR